MIQNYKYYSGLLLNQQQLASIHDYLKTIGVKDSLNNTKVVNKDMSIIIALIKYLKQVDMYDNNSQSNQLFFKTFIDNCSKNGITDFSIDYNNDFVIEQLRRIYLAAYSIAVNSAASKSTFLNTVKNRNYRPMPITAMNMTSNMRQNLTMLFRENENQSVVLPISVQLTLNGIYGFK